MVELRIVAGKSKGQVISVARFPFAIGRGAADLPLADDGVWDHHLRLELEAAQGLLLSLQPGALGTLNGQPFQSARLRNGDLVEIGAAKLQFWLSPTRARSWRWREGLTWFCLALLGLAQVALIYWLT